MQPLALLARHGDTQGNEERIFRSRLNFPLNQKGIQDAHELAAHIATHYKPAVVVASPMERAKTTAAIVGQRIGKPVELDGRLLPWHSGLLTGKKRTAQSEAVRDFYVQHADQRIPGGESIADSESRMRDILGHALRVGASGRLPLLVTHGSGLKAAETVLRGARSAHGDAAVVEPGGLAGIFPKGNGLEIRPLFKGGTGSEVTS